MKKLIRDTVELTNDTARFTSALSALTRFSRRQERLEHPEGSFDNAGRFYPSDSEDCGVSSYIRSPSRSYPHSYMLACRTLDHCERLEDADHDDVLLLRRFFKSIEIDTTNKTACLAAIAAVVPQAVAEERAARAHRVPRSKSKVLPAMPDVGRARARA
jgi:hypothetical protein